MIINNILSTDLLNQQDFKYKLSEMSNDLLMFEITNTEEQIFYALSTQNNLYYFSVNST